MTGVDAELERQLVRAWLAGYAQAVKEVDQALEGPQRARKGALRGCSFGWPAVVRRRLRAVAHQRPPSPPSTESPPSPGAAR